MIVEAPAADTVAERKDFGSMPLRFDSAMTLLEIIVPAVCGKDTTVQSRLIVFEGKQDLEKQLTRRLRG